MIQTCPLSSFSAKFFLIKLVSAEYYFIHNKDHCALVQCSFLAFLLEFVEPDVLEEVKKKLNLGSVKFEVHISLMHLCILLSRLFLCNNRSL